ncbi:CHAP domain-containing protein [Anaerotruncus colihominis]|uniref:CHAP domain-containing protein n=1 Tax=Anaerotruncus colihominis TaxID=169435 RepID=A0A845SWW1_9FIRM|nr:CHAP domain-containing protein [Anaerotruncus colihominis]
MAVLDTATVEKLRVVFWDMTKITSAEADVEHPAEDETPAWTEKVLTITVTPRTPDDMRVFYAFTGQQNAALDELLAAATRDMWHNLLYGSSGEIVAVALSQVGNVGGQPYWSWYGFNSRVEWCACFVSWCANECGYIDAGVIPKFAGCTGGSNWFKDRGQWQDGDYEPRPGDLIFFDWNNKGGSGPQDDVPDHVGIVERVENGVVYTVEGNSGDSCRQRSYSVGHYEIWGYGCPIYN